MPAVTYRLGPDLTPEAFTDVLVRSTLPERRPVHDAGTIRAILRNADLIQHARPGLAGRARTPVASNVRTGSGRAPPRPLCSLDTVTGSS